MYRRTRFWGVIAPIPLQPLVGIVVIVLAVGLFLLGIPIYLLHWLFVH